MILFFRIIFVLFCASILYSAAQTVAILWNQHPAALPTCSAALDDSAIQCRAHAAVDPELCRSIADRDLRSHCWFAVSDIQRRSKPWNNTVYTPLIPALLLCCVLYMYTAWLVKYMPIAHAFGSIPTAVPTLCYSSATAWTYTVWITSWIIR
jgi:hypothetical protein